MKFRAIANLFLILCCVVAVYAISVKVAKPKAAAGNSAFVSDLKERDLAIQKANQVGSSSYSFTTNFVPGVGYPNVPSTK